MAQHEGPFSGKFEFIDYKVYEKLEGGSEREKNILLQLSSALELFVFFEGLMLLLQVDVVSV